MTTRTAENRVPSRGFAGKLADPEVRKERSRKAAAVINSPDGLARRLGRKVSEISPEVLEQLLEDLNAEQQRRQDTETTEPQKAQVSA